MLKKSKFDFVCSKCNTQAQFYPNKKWCPEDGCVGRLLRVDHCMVCTQPRANRETAICDYCTEILSHLRPFLRNRSESEDSGWPKVTPEDTSRLSMLIYYIIKAKWGPDADGDLPVQTRIIDRTRYQWHGFLIPYPHLAEDLPALMKIFEKTLSSGLQSIGTFQEVARLLALRIDEEVGRTEDDDEGSGDLQQT